MGFYRRGKQYLGVKIKRGKRGVQKQKNLSFCAQSVKGGKKMGGVSLWKGIC